MKNIDTHKLKEVFELLDARLQKAGMEKIELDQIHFKLYASVDRGGYHIEDLLALKPNKEELVQAAKWTMTHDVSEGFAIMLKELLTQLGFADAAKQI